MNPPDGPPGLGKDPVLVTERLRLRPFRLSDRADHDAYESRPDVTRYLPYDARTPQQAEVALARKVLWNALETEGERLVLAIERRFDGRVIGEVHLVWADAVHRQAEVGFVLHPDWQGQGLAAEAVRAAMDALVSGLGAHRIFGNCDADNTASARLMERLGMAREAQLRHTRHVDGQWRDTLVYAWHRPSPHAGSGA